MSMDLTCYLKLGSVRSRVPVMGVGGADRQIAYQPNGDKRPWREAAKLYLAVVARIAPAIVERRAAWPAARSPAELAEIRGILKAERKKIGVAWHLAEAGGGVLEFDLH